MFLFLVVLAVLCAGGQAVPLPVLFDSTAVDGHWQDQLRRGVFMGLRDVDADDELQPSFIDLGEEGLDRTLSYVLGNETKGLVSLLDSDALLRFGRAYANQSQEQLRVFTPRALELSPPFPLTVTSLQMNSRAKARVIVERMRRVGIEWVVAVLDEGSESQQGLLAEYEAEGSSLNPPLRFRPSIRPYPGFRYEFNDTGFRTAVLLLARTGARAALEEGLLEAEKHHFRWFAHDYETIDDATGKAEFLFGLYAAQYAGSQHWGNPQRRRLLVEFRKFTGPNPSVLSVVLAYDAAVLARNYVQNELHLPTTGLSGIIALDEKGYRKEGRFFGITAVRSRETSAFHILEASSWLLEDFFFVRSVGLGVVHVSDYQYATSSVFPRSELLELAQQAEKSRTCAALDMKVTTTDPFTQLPYTYEFRGKKLPSELVVPSQYGYTMEFYCATNKSHVSFLEMACMPDGVSISEPVSCYMRRRETRHRRSLGYPAYANPSWAQLYWPRDDSAANSYLYQPPAMNNYYTGSYAGYADSSTPSTLTTRLDVPISEEPITPAPPAPAPSKLPELRQVLKAAKPFVGSCIGSTTGCAVCVLVLGRLPLGAVPAACTGPCFVGTFGSCGSLLGRVFSETTVICTELYEQGLLDSQTFLADGQFGRQVRDEAPMTYLGYKILATPLVQGMRKSEVLTKVVASFALPWAQHMRHSLGQSVEPSRMGFWVQTIGTPLCTSVGLAATAFQAVADQLKGSTLQGSGLTAGLLLTLISVASTKALLSKRRTL